MPTYSTLNRFSRTQYENEERKQQAHLKKISEMQSHSGINNGAPHRCPHLHQGFVKQLSDKRLVIDKENEVKSKKLLTIMTSKPSSLSPPSPSSPRKSQTSRTRTTHSSQNNTAFLERVAKAKGKYDAQKWRKEYEQHKEHLKLRKNNSVFTPLDVGSHRQRNIHTHSLPSDRQSEPT